MSNTSVYRDNSASPSERRHHMRRRVSTLAYLDIGADNGGIIVNLSEEGMAFQAVGPVDSQAGLSLRVQLPDTRIRISTEAQIVWLRESNRLAGVRFLDLSSEGRKQIQQWVRSTTLPDPPSETVLPQRVIAKKPQGKQGTIRAPRKDKWLTLMAELRAPETADQSPLPVAEPPEIRSHAPAEQEASATLPAPEIGSRHLTEPVESLKQALRLSEVPPHSTAYQPRTEPPHSRPDGNPNGQDRPYAAVAVTGLNRADKEAVLERPIPVSRTAPPGVPKPSILPIAPAEPTASGVDSKTNPEPVFAATIPAVPVATGRSPARKWVVVAVLFVLYSIANFGIGTWLGSLRTRVHSLQSSTLPVAAEPVIKPGPSRSQRRKPSVHTSPIANKTRAERAGDNAEPETLKRNLELSTSSPVVQSEQQDIQSAPTKQSPAAVTAAKSPGNSSPLTPVPDNSAAPPAPRIVAGRTLRPTDRFNPPHLTYRVDPTYPAEAKQQGIEGAVKIHLVIGADGTVRSMKLLSGSTYLAPAAMDAARYWQYLPALLNGQPIEADQDIEIDFHLPH